jgi:hypothetical protein
VNDTWETREQLLDAASNAGYPLSAPQLGRLHRAGLIPAPVVKALGRGRGTESRFPAGSAARLVRVAEVHSTVHRLSALAWRLWWEDGGEIPPPAREALRRVAASVDAERDRLATLLEESEAGTAEGEAGLDKLYADAERSNLYGPLAELRRNVGREQFGAVVHGLGAAVVGRAQATAHSDAELDTLLKRTFGFDRDQADRAADEPSEKDGESLDLESLAQLSAAHSAIELAEADSAELDQARAQAHALARLASAAASLLDRFGDRGTPRLRPASRMLAGERPRDQMLFLLGVLALRGDDELRSGLEEIRVVRTPQAVAVDQIYALICKLREEIPVLTETMSDARLAAAQRDGEAGAALEAEITRLRAEHVDEFNAFFAAHPEASTLIADFEASPTPWHACGGARLFVAGRPAYDAARPLGPRSRPLVCGEAVAAGFVEYGSRLARLWSQTAHPITGWT